MKEKFSEKYIFHISDYIEECTGDRKVSKSQAHHDQPVFSFVPTDKKATITLAYMLITYLPV